MIYEMKNKKHHYVWRKYLRPWAKDEQIFALQDKKIFKTNLMNIGQENNFYGFSPLNESESTNLLHFLEDINYDEMPNEIKVGTESYKLLSVLVNIARKSEDSDAINQIDDLLKNLGEYEHSVFESANVKYLDLLLSKNATFYHNRSERFFLLVFAHLQFWRTRKMRNRLLGALGTQSNIDVSSIYNYAKLPLAWSQCTILDNCGSTLTLLHNETDAEFITCDQPIIPLRDLDNISKDNILPLPFYCALSPSLAVIAEFKRQNGEHDVMDKHLSEEDVKIFNNAIKNSSLKQIYATSEIALS